MRLGFLTSTPLDVTRGSGTYAGIRTLARALEALGVRIEIFAPKIHFPVYTLERLAFNERLRWRGLRGCDATVGFDLDGYRIAGRSQVPHVASIKGVIADEMRFEGGLTRATMAVQAACEAVHVRRADLVLTTSRYAALRLRQLYGIPRTPAIVPEAIDLEAWRELFRRNRAEPDPATFTVLSVCRFYPRKRLPVLLEAAARLRPRIPELEVRIVGGGPEARRLHRLAQELDLGTAVRWLGDISQDELAREYNRAHLFCLPSVQEGFGIVFLEAMAAGRAIVAARAAAAPEVVQHGLLVKPDDDEALAEGILQLYEDPVLRASLGEAGRRAVEQFEAKRVARLFLAEIEKLLGRGSV